MALAAGAAPFLWNSPWAAMAFAGTVCAVAAGVFLLRNPLFSLYLAVFFALLPSGLRFDPMYTIVSNLSVAIALVGWISQWLLRRERVHWNITWVLLAAYIAFGILTILWAPDLVEGRRKAVAYIIGFILLFLIINQVRTLRTADGLMAVLRCIGWIIVSGGLFEIASGGYRPGERLSVYDINQNQLVMIMLLLIPGFVWPVLRNSGGRRKVRLALALVFLLFTFVFIALSGSRGGALSLAAVFAGSLLSRQVRPWGMLSIVLVVGFVFAVPSVLDTLNQRFEEQEGGGFGGRDMLWETGLLLIQDHPWTGVGLGGGPLELPKYIAVMTGNAFLNSRHSFPSHNPLLEVGADTGIFGMLLYGAMLASAVWQSVRQKPGSGRAAISAYYRPLILIIAAAYSLSWIKSGGVENHPTFFILLGLLLLPSLISTGKLPEDQYLPRLRP